MERLAGVRRSFFACASAEGVLPSGISTFAELRLPALRFTLVALGSKALAIACHSCRITCHVSRASVIRTVSRRVYLKARAVCGDG